MSDDAKVERILEFLISESGSHDYTIYRQEAREELGLKVERPTDDLYAQIKAIYDDFAAELQLGEPYSPDVALGGQPQVNYEVRRALVESVRGGSHYFLSKGELIRRQVQVAPGVLQNAVEDHRTLEGWHYESA